MKIIWHQPDGEYFDIKSNVFRRFRKHFTLAKSFTEDDSNTFEINIACSGKYILYVNGNYVARGPVRYDRRWPQYDVLDISDELKTGGNVVAILCLYEGYGTGQSMISPPGLALELNARRDSSPHQLILCSDESWKSSEAEAFDCDAPRINGRQGSIEIFNAQLDEPDWTIPDFDDHHWPVVRVHKHALKVSHLWNLKPRDIPLLDETRQTANGIIATGEGNARLLAAEKATVRIWQNLQLFLDQTSLTLRNESPEAEAPSAETHKAILQLHAFAKLYAGYLQLHVSGTAGQIIDCIYLEALPPATNGKLNLKSLITPENRPMDRFILDEGENHLEVAFGWKAFRYVLLVIHPSRSFPAIKKVSIVSREYPFRRLNRFMSSDPELNSIFEICQHTARICAQDAFVDSPSREQQQWIGDGRWTALVYFHLTGDSQLYRRMLVQIGQSQDFSGMIKPRHPDDHNNIPPIPAFALSWISAFYEYFLHTGDLKLVREWWPNIEHLLAWFRRHQNDDGVLSNVPGWFFIDWGNPPQLMDVMRGGEVAALNLQYVEALLFSAEISEALGEKQTCKEIREQVFSLQAECRKLFWNQSLGAYIDCVTDGKQSTTISEQTNALALLFLHGTGPYPTINFPHHSKRHPERIDQILRNVFSHAWKPDDNLSNSSTPVPSSPFYMIRLLQALSLHDEHHLALDILKARYRIFLQADSTTTWEKWTLYRLDDEGNQHIDSASHGWGASPVLFFFNELLGISPLRPGYEDHSFNPHLAGLEYLSGNYRFPGKNASLAIEVSPGRVNLTQL